MLEAEYSSQFKRDVKLAQKRGKNMDKLKGAIELLLTGDPLPLKYREHALTGNWTGVMDAHLEPDWLLLYTRNKNIMRFERTGTHADIFSA